LKVRVVIGGEAYEVEIEDTGDDSARPDATEGVQSLVLSQLGSAVHTDERVYVSPVAGLVTRVIVKAGDEVQMNAVLLVLEAMKMETSIVAAADGKVKSVRVAQGEAVKVNQILLEFE
jgi:biotin carboxyl carrier protein